ncbi:MAG: SPFH domain-containing protein [Candidatus Zambryskibacteria bacterium]|nr:SPFH domain-containing protein [Candidatus Zambryskibacteria bacterium]
MDIVILSGLLLAGIIALVLKNKPEPTSSGTTRNISTEEHNFFATLQSEHIMFVASGNGKHVRTIPDIAGHRLNEVGDIVVGTPEWGVLDRIMRKINGTYFIGPRFLRHKHSFTLIVSKENPDATAESSPNEWITPGVERRVTELRRTFPRSVLVPNVEFRGMLRGNIRVLGNFEVKNPYRAVFTQNAKFFELIESYLRTATNEFCQKMTTQEFELVNKQLGGTFSDYVVKTINENLIRETGIAITGASISLFDSSDKETQRLLELEKKTEIEGNAAINKAKKEGEAKVITATATNEANKLLAISSVADVIATVTGLKELGVSPDVAAQSATAIAEATRVAKLASLTVYAPGKQTTIPAEKPRY